jgi:hypothetical protein
MSEKKKEIFYMRKKEKPANTKEIKEKEEKPRK